jgi:hypothetical protein
MNEYELRRYNMAQIDEINRYKWIESERLGYDIGSQRAAFEWIKKYSEYFHCAFPIPFERLRNE